MTPSSESDGHDKGLTPPIAHAVRVGNTIYIAGQLADDENGGPFAPGDLVAQSERIFETMSGILAEHGATLQNVVKLVTYFSVPLSEQLAQEYWSVRRRYFGSHRPASTGVQVVSLIEPGYVIEIEGIAFLE
ncbi:hypothetical protein ASC61_10405 [Aeromicrobium sp. Root344]|uniref:RidA family protein n=1 Tax=Aeromicrobium sp. Root344 TaxID=1736521 RepID=UPI0006F4D76B|nr:RidA family protein [Aeromicrobium sp. Root344]KQV75380.1 hypothetical protein ASC61_10405 [Aeromicrobium sp. Root344]